MEIKDLYDIFLQSAGVCTDTRTLKKNQLFFALKGENFDGNRFALQALEKGASYAVAGEDLQADDPRLIKVPDTLETLKALAAYHRRQLRIPVIGLTGTNGKTTTKELIKTALGAAYRVSATEGNLNNEIGVPLTVLKIGPRAQLAIVEMGASHPEDLKPLLAVAQPNLGLITNVGKAQHDGVVFANAEDPVLQEMLSQRGLEAITYSREGVTVKADPFVELDFEDAVLKTHLVGAYNAANILAALKLAWYFDVPREDALQAIASYVPSNNRSQLVKTEKNTLIVDAYNANPENLSLMPGRKVALLGDMRELGADAAAEHRKIVERLEGMEAFLVGEEFTSAAKGKPYKTFATSEDLAKYLKENPLEGCTVLLKGSHSMQMEKLTDVL